MSHNDYQHPRGRELKGHKPDCAYTDFHGDICECDDLRPKEVYNAMLLLGWDHDEGSAKGRSFIRFYDPHYIGVSKLIDGWQFRWERGPGSTMFEERGFATIGHLMKFTWGLMAEEKDWSMKTSWEWGQMRQQLKDVGIEPRELGKKPEAKKDAPVGLLKHEVTAIMDGRE